MNAFFNSRLLASEKFPTNFRIVTLPDTNTVILQDSYYGTITEPGLPVSSLHFTGLLSNTNYFLIITYHVFPSLSLFPKALYDPSERLYVNSLWYPNTNDEQPNVLGSA